MYDLLRVVGTTQEALQEWVLAIDWLEWGSEEIKLCFKYPWWGYDSRGQLGRGVSRQGIHDQFEVGGEMRVKS